MGFRQVIHLTTVHAMARAERDYHDIELLGAPRNEGVVTIHDLVLRVLRPEFRDWIDEHVPSARFTWSRYPQVDASDVRWHNEPNVDMIIRDADEAFAYHMRWRGA